MNTPTRKVGIGAVAGAVSAILIWAVGRYGLAVPGEIGSAVTTVLTFAASYFVTDPE